MRFLFQVEVEVERESGKFASRDEIEAELQDALEQGDPGEVSGIGADSDSTYTVSLWDVSAVSDR